MRVSFDWLKNYVDIRVTPEMISQNLTMAGLEVTSFIHLDKDVIMEIEVTPNRSDCLSIIGIAREVAAISGKKLKLPRIPAMRGSASASVSIQIQDKQLCGRYLGRAIKNVQVGPSPDWLIHRLETMGVRAVNNIVDITNFCLLEFGQPLHAFDLDKLQGRRVVVRMAQDGEEIITIDGVKRTLDKSMLVIADKFQPQAIAGIMGAAGSEVSEETTNILLESAYFDPLSVHNTSRKLGLATHSSYRFERGVDLEAVYQTSLRAADLIKKLARPTKAKAASSLSRARRKKAMVIGRLINKGTKEFKGEKVHLNFARVGELLGQEISVKKMKESLQALGFSIVRRSKDGLTVKVPSFRQDISREVDLIEEVTRLYGYDNIPLRLECLTPKLEQVGKYQLLSAEVYDQIRQTLAELGLNEIMNYSLVSREVLGKLGLPFENVIAVANPLSYEQEILRPTLLAGMLNSIAANINRKNTNLKLFELSRVYLKKPAKGTEEFNHLCIGVAGRKDSSWQLKLGEYSFFDLKGILQALFDKLGLGDCAFSEGEFPLFIPGRAAEIFLGKESLGFCGEVKKDVLGRFGVPDPVFLCELKVQKLIAHVRQTRRFVPLARFPAIGRDISLIASPKVSSGQIVSLIKKIGGDLIANVVLFDQYSGEQIPEGFRGLNFSVEYRSSERTLTAEEIDKLHTQVRRALSDELKVQVR